PVPYENISFYNELVKDSLEKGAKIINTKKKDIETLFHPKILYPVNKDMKISYLEQFGPIVPIMPFKNIEDVLEMISLSNYGQQCSIFGKDHNIIGNMIDVLINQVSRINLNTQCQRGPDSFPFAGRKDSAVGTLSISDALKIFSIRTLVSAKITEENKKLYENILKDNSSDFLKRDILF
ncbi:aldehyde dehydrogenase family protein, partial [bacterium]|nr:aldehyde dehydrogenase family protein [bacterium]